MSEDSNILISFQLKTDLKFGIGASEKIRDYLKEFKFERIGIVIDSAICTNKYGNLIMERIKQGNFELVNIWEYNLNREPDYDSLDRVKKMFQDKDSKPLIDCFIAIGGGSVIDFAKGLATLVVNPGEALNYRGFPTDINPSLPTIAIPTTAGTGSEVTYNAVFIDTQERKKLGINTKHNYPVLAILDPLLTLSCPELVTVSAGMDALVHTLESYTCIRSNQLTRLYAKEAFSLIFNSLSRILDDPENLTNRGNLQLGAYLAGISLMNSGSGPSGALSYTLGVHFNVPHGIAGGIFIPHLISHNVKNGYDYSELYDLIAGVNKNKNAKEKNSDFEQQIFNLRGRLKIPASLKDFNVNEENIVLLLKDTENYSGAFAQNPIPFSVEDGKDLLKKLIK